MKSFNITFDIDMTDYLSDVLIDEMDAAFEPIQQVLMRYPDVKTTWFVRMDGQIEALFGAADHIFKKHGSKIVWLKENGHGIEWHYHGYKQEDNVWKQSTDDVALCAEIERYGKIAQTYGMKIARMGWGYHSLSTMKKLASIGFKMDSSAIPRPVYSWETTKRNWEGTTNKPYYPSVNDYRVPGAKWIDILEIPMTTTRISVPTDEGIVKRYMNLAYYSNYFESALDSLSDEELIVSITHPYELLPNERPHSLLSFDINVFEKNIKILLARGFNMTKMSSLQNKKYEIT